MSETRRNLIAAASEIVRDEGFDALSVRRVAERSCYGKSTVHAAFGTFSALTAAVRSQAEADLCEVLGGDEFRLDDPASAQAMFRRMSAWILSDPNWAEACFSRVEAEVPVGWRDNALRLFGDVLPPGCDRLSEREFAQVSVMGGRQIAALIPLIADSQDVAFGARLLEATMLSLYRCFRVAVEHSAATQDTRARVLTPIRTQPAPALAS